MSQTQARPVQCPVILDGCSSSEEVIVHYTHHPWPVQYVDKTGHPISLDIGQFAFS